MARGRRTARTRGSATPPSPQLGHDSTSQPVAKPRSPRSPHRELQGSPLFAALERRLDQEERILDRRPQVHRLSASSTLLHRGATQRYCAPVLRRRFSALLLASPLLACRRGTDPDATPPTQPADGEPPAEEASPSTAVKTIYIVRHAEKEQIEGERDPELTEAGHARAAALRDRLATAELAALYSSEYRRTLQTVAPIAEASGLEVTLYDPAAPAAELAEILRSSEATQLLVAGHSNTIPALISALGAVAEPIDEGRYGDLFVVILGGEQVELRVEHVGA